MCGDILSDAWLAVQSYMQSVQQHAPGASVGLLDQAVNDTPHGATEDSLVFMTPIADVES